MVFEKLQKMLVDEYALSESDVTMDALFTDDLGLDSLDLVEIIVFIEDEFGVPAPDDDEIQNIKTVGDAVDYITRNIEA